MIQINDDGMMAVSITAQGVTVEQPVDLFAAYGVVVDAYHRGQAEGQGRNVWLVSVRDWLGLQGFPAGCSLYAADRFAAAVMAAVDVLKKKGGGEPAPNSPASTEPTLSP